MEELELIVGARVYCRNGKFGRLAKIVVDPRRWRVTHIIVEEGFLKKRFRILPISIVEQATTGDVYLGVCDDEIARFPEYGNESDETPVFVNGTTGETELPAIEAAATPAPGHGMAPHLIVVERGTPIENMDGSLGRLDYVLVSADEGQITGFVLQQRMIPNAMVQHIDENRISVAAIPGDEARVKA